MTNYLSNLYLSGLIALFAISACTPQAAENTITGINPPEWSYSQTIYEVNIRQYSPEGSFTAVKDDLPRLKELGVGIIWLMPIHPIGELNRKGTLGSYYSVRDYFDVNPEFGTKDDFRALVEATHAHGMYLILDWVANHTAWDNPLTISHPDFFETDEVGNFIPPRGTDWDDVIQLDYENPEVWDYMISALRYWVEEFDIDGYRADVADMVPTPFWERARAELDSVKPVFMLAEAENPEHHYASFDMSYSWRMHHLFNAIAQGREPVSKIDEYLNEDRKRFPANAFRMQFTSNHDENSWNGTVFERMGDAVKTFAVLASTIEGMPLLYNGQESGMSKRLEFFEKDPIEWEHNEYFVFYSRLFNLNLNNKALFNGTRGGKMQRLSSDSDDQLYAFIREKDGDKVIVVLNLSSDELSTVISSELMSGTYTDLFTDQTVSFSSMEIFNMQPWEYRVYFR
jgi:cyclomaltodextrinase / maltogenic alpha-amylase / neopullulanase